MAPARERAVIITDGAQRASLAAVRSLGAAGYGVHVTSTSGHSLAGSSRYARGDWRTPDPLRDSAGFAEAVRLLARDLDASLVIPITEPAVHALLPRREELGNATIPFPSYAAFNAISDKAEVTRAAAAVGLCVPAQQLVRSHAEAAALDLAALVYPIVVKPTRSVVGVEGGRVKASVRHAANADALQRALSALGRPAYPVLLQQRIVGPGVGIFLLIWDGEPVAAFAHRRLREKPPSGGVSVYRESIPLDETLLQLSRQLLDRFGWNGVAMVELKLDEQTGTPYIMEVNGRFWGSLQLAIDAGVDFPRLLAAAALGDPVSPVMEYRSGVRSRWFWGDVDHLVARLRFSPAALDLPEGTGGRAAALREFVARHPGDRAEVFRRDDLRPFWRESIEWLRHAGRTT